MTTIRICKTCNKLSFGSYCLACGKGFGRVCTDGHRLPDDGGMVCACGERGLLPQTPYTDLTIPIWVLAWGTGLLLLSLIVRHAGQLLDSGSQVFKVMFGVTPLGLFIVCLDRMLFWTIVIVLLSLVLPKPLGGSLRGWWFRAVCGGFSLIIKALRLAAIGLRLVVEGKRSTAPENKGGH